MRLSTRSPDVYFATIEDPEDLAREIWDRVSDFYVRMRGRIYYQRALESFRTYYGLRTGNDPFDVTQIEAGGDTGSHSLIKMNHYYSIGQALVTMTTAQRPDWKCVAENDDYESLQDTLLAQGLLDYYMRETGLELQVRQAVESAVIMGDGYILLTWDPAAGREITPELGDGTPATFEGDVQSRTLTPFDVPLDLDWRGAGERPWVITRDFVNKWDLAEQYPGSRDEIINSRIDRASEGAEPSYMSGTTFDGDFQTDTDQVAVFTLWHRKTKAVKQGLMAVILNSRTCLFSGGLPYGEHLPLHRVAPATMTGSTTGHTPQINLISIQKAISAAWSASVTNLSLFGAGSLLVPKGAGLNVSDMGGGAIALEWDGDKKPEPLNVPGLNPAAIQMAEALVRAAETISGVNSTIRGNASPQLSGARMALEQQMAIQYTSGLVQGYTKLLESTGTGLVRILQQYAKAPKMALIVGTAKAPMLKEFTGQDISRVSRVTVQSGNAMSKTPGGKMAIADQLLQMQQINAQQYMAIIDTGTLDPVLTSPITQQALIRKENQMMSQARFATEEEIAAGKAVQVPTGQWVMGVPPVLATDNHSWHEPEHASVLDNPAVRENPAVVAATLFHLSQHKGFQAAPDGGIPPNLPPGTQPAPAALPPGTNPNPPPPPPGPPGAPAPIPPQQGPGGPQGPKLPNLPTMPRNPLTGQKASLVSG